MIASSNRKGIDYRKNKHGLKRGQGRIQDEKGDLENKLKNESYPKSYTKLNLNC